MSSLGVQHCLPLAETRTTQLCHFAKRVSKQLKGQGPVFWQWKDVGSIPAASKF